MSNSITRTYTFSNGGVADGGQVDSEIQNIVNTINNADAGTTAWTVVKGTTVNALALQINSNPFSYTPLSSWTPTISGFGSTANTTAKYLNTGGLAYCWVTFQAGTTAASTASITLPVNINAGLSSSGSYLGKAAQGRAENLLSNGDDVLVFYDGSTAGSAFFSTTGSGTSPIYSKANGNSICAANLYFSMFFSYPS